MFDVDELVQQCLSATAESEPRLAIRDVLDRTLAAPGEVADVLAPTEGGLTVLHASPELTILHVVWAPGMRIYPHDHLMWAAIGIYTGQEDNAFYRRNPEGDGHLVRSGGTSLATGDVALLGDDAIHSVANPLRQLTGAIHSYGGDFVNQRRSQWDADLGNERPNDLAESQRQFAEANAAWLADQA